MYCNYSLHPFHLFFGSLRIANFVHLQNRIMKSFKFTLLILFLSLNAISQTSVFIWTDTSTTYVNHRIVSLIEYEKNLYALTKSQDINFENPHPAFSKISLQGKVQNFTVYKDASDIYDLNALVVQPDKKIRIYGTCNTNGIFVPYINSVTQAGVMENSSFIMVSVPHFVGDAKQVSSNECVWAKSIRGSATNRYNAYVYRIDMSKNDNIVWKAILSSEFNEECSKLTVLPDTSVILLCKRYTDETFLSWVPVIYKMDAKGAILWNKELSDYSDFSGQNIIANKEAIYYTNYNGNEKNGTSNGVLVKLDQQGEILNRIAVENMNPNGALILKSGNILLYGGVYKPAGRNFVKKGKVMLYDSKGMKIKEREMGELDRPDAELPGMVISMMPTSSEFITALQLSDGRIALAGRVYMPLHEGPDEILLSDRANRNLLVFAKEDGTWPNVLDEK